MLDIVIVITVIGQNSFLRVTEINLTRARSEPAKRIKWNWLGVGHALRNSDGSTAKQVFNPFNASCSKLLRFEGFSAILV